MMTPSTLPAAGSVSVGQYVRDSPMCKTLLLITRNFCVNHLAHGRSGLVEIRRTREGVAVWIFCGDLLAATARGVTNGFRGCRTASQLLTACACRDVSLPRLPAPAFRHRLWPDQATVRQWSGSPPAVQYTVIISMPMP
jgi:hypothetical protein